MKKNNMLRLASVLLVAVLLSTCAISGVFAYYYTTADADDSARVAKWGVEVTASTGAFSAKYDVADDPNFTVVSANGTDKVVAPGTDGALAAMTLTGTPEVDVKVTMTADVDLTGWVVPNGGSTKEYCPIVITVNGTPYTQTGTIAEFEAAVEAAILGANAGAAGDDGTTAVYNYDANTNLADVDNNGANHDVTVTWAWAIGGQSADDTALGDQAAAGNAAEIAIDVSVMVEQVGD